MKLGNSIYGFLMWILIVGCVNVPPPDATPQGEKNLEGVLINTHCVVDGKEKNDDCSVLKWLRLDDIKKLYLENDTAQVRNIVNNTIDDYCNNVGKLKFPEELSEKFIFGHDRIKIAETCIGVDLFYGKGAKSGMSVGYMVCESIGSFTPICDSYRIGVLGQKGVFYNSDARVYITVEQEFYSRNNEKNPVATIVMYDYADNNNDYGYCFVLRGSDIEYLDDFIFSKCLSAILLIKTMKIQSDNQAHR